MRQLSILAPLLIPFLSPIAPAQTPVRHVDRPAISGRLHHAMAFDQARARMVLFGAGKTWIWSGHRWELQHPTNRPSARTRAEMAYDPTRRRLVLFGGEDAGGKLQDTWEWDGVDWARVRTQHAPSARIDHSMAFDPIGKRILLFGGGGTAETWAFDGVDWLKIAASTTPTNSGRQTMVADTRRGRVVLLAGIGPFTTWEWNGVDWQQASLGQGPAAAVAPKFRAPLAYDSRRGRVVFFGYDTHQTRPGPTTWEWDGYNWMEALRGSGPAAIVGARLAFDEARGETLLFGGSADLYGALIRSARPLEPAETWRWNGQTWTLASISESGDSPSVAVARDSARKRIVSLGSHLVGQRATGCLPGPCPDEYQTFTREWNGAEWQLAMPAQQPPHRERHALAFDSGRLRTIVFGGAAITQTIQGAVLLERSDTWAWDGIHWTNLKPTSNPPARQFHAMAFDTARGRTVLFGGYQAVHNPWFPTITVFDDTWQFDGTQWVKLAPAVSPSLRYGHRMVCDPIRGRVVLFGGRNQNGDLDDTWEWDGSTWTEIKTLVSPPGGAHHAMAVDPLRGRTVLYAKNELWDFDGVRWIPRVSSIAIPTAAGSAMEFDSVRGAMVMTSANATRILGNITPAQVTTIGRGCAGTGTIPRLSSPPASVGDRRFVFTIDDGPAQARGLLAFSTAHVAVPLGGSCVWQLGSTYSTVPIQTNTFGHADVPMPVPLDLDLRGLTLHAQTVLLDPSHLTLGLALTHALTLELGD